MTSPAEHLVELLNKDGATRITSGSLEKAFDHLRDRFSDLLICNESSIRLTANTVLRALALAEHELDVAELKARISEAERQIEKNQAALKVQLRKLDELEKS